VSDGERSPGPHPRGESISIYGADGGEVVTDRGHAIGAPVANSWSFIRS